MRHEEREPVRPASARVGWAHTRDSTLNSSPKRLTREDVGRVQFPDVVLAPRRQPPRGQAVGVALVGTQAVPHRRTELRRDAEAHAHPSQRPCMGGWRGRMVA